MTNTDSSFERTDFVSIPVEDLERARSDGSCSNGGHRERGIVNVQRRAPASADRLDQLRLADSPRRGCSAVAGYLPAGRGSDLPTRRFA